MIAARVQRGHHAPWGWDSPSYGLSLTHAPLPLISHDICAGASGTSRCRTWATEASA